MPKKKAPVPTFATAADRASAFSIATATYETLEADYRKAKTVLEAIPGHASGIMGLTPDSVRLTPEYRAAYFGLQKVMTVQREFSDTYVRTFQKELLAERDERRRKMADANQARLPATS